MAHDDHSRVPATQGAPLPSGAHGSFHRSSAFWTGGVLSCVILAFVVVELLFATVGPGPALRNGHLTDAQTKAIDVMLKLCDSFITWAVATVGAGALLLKINIEQQSPYTRGDAILVVLSMLCAVISIFCGHLAMDLTSRALAVDQFPTTVEPVHQFLRCQYLFALAGIALLGFFSVQYFLRQAGRNPKRGGQK